MAKINPIAINCSTVVKNILCEALRNYTFIVLPKSNTTEASEKEKILFEIDYINKNFDSNTKQNIIHNGLQNYCHAAINFHYDRIEQNLNASVEEQRKLMLNMLDGVPTYDEQLDFALQQDNLI